MQSHPLCQMAWSLGKTVSAYVEQHSALDARLRPRTGPMVHQDQLASADLADHHEHWSGAEVQACTSRQQPTATSEPEYSLHDTSSSGNHTASAGANHAGAQLAAGSDVEQGQRAAGSAAQHSQPSHAAQAGANIIPDTKGGGTAVQQSQPANSAGSGQSLGSHPASAGCVPSPAHNGWSAMPQPLAKCTGKHFDHLSSEDPAEPQHLGAQCHLTSAGP